MAGWLFAQESDWNERRQMWSTEENAPTEDWIVAGGENEMWVAVDVD